MKNKYEYNRQIEDIGSLLSLYVKEQKWSEKLIDANAVMLYNAYPDDELKGSRAKYVLNGALVIGVVSPILATEISLKQSKIIWSINKQLGKNTIKKLRFNVSS